MEGRILRLKWFAVTGVLILSFLAGCGQSVLGEQSKVIREDKTDTNTDSTEKNETETDFKGVSKIRYSSIQSDGDMGRE